MADGSTTPDDVGSPLPVPPRPVPPLAPDPLQTRSLAVLLGRMAIDHRGLLDYLAGSFSVAMPAATSVQRKGLFNRGRAESVRVHLGSTVYELVDRAGRIEPSIGSSVGGVALTRGSVSVDEWVTRFAAALDEAASTSDDIQAALARLL